MQKPTDSDVNTQTYTYTHNILMIAMNEWTNEILLPRHEAIGQFYAHMHNILSAIVNIHMFSFTNCSAPYICKHAQ